MANMNNIAGISVATSANNNNQNNNYNFYRMSGGHDFADLAGAVEEMRDVNSAIGVRGHEGIRIFVRRDEGMWTLMMFNLVGIGKVSHEEKYNLGQRMTANMVKRIENLVLAFIDTIANYEQEQSDWDKFVDMCGRKDALVSEYQTEIDGYVQDILMIADRKSDIHFKMDAFAIKEILKKIAQTETDCYDAIMDAEYPCFGIEIDLSALWNWMNNYSQDYTDPCFDRECIDLGELIDTLDYMCGMEWDMPLAEDDVVESVAEDTPWLPMATPLYLDDAVIDYVSTYYHYAYCA